MNDAYLMPTEIPPKNTISTLLAVFSLLLTTCGCLCLGLMGPILSLCLCSLALYLQKGRYGPDRSLNLSLAGFGLIFSILCLLIFMLFFGIGLATSILPEMWEILQSLKPQQTTF